MGWRPGLLQPLVAARRPLVCFFERPAVKNRTASPGWYKSAAFTRAAEDAGLYAANLNGDAFSAELKQATIELIKKDLGQIDMVIYSLAAPAPPTS